MNDHVDLFLRELTVLCRKYEVNVLTARKFQMEIMHPYKGYYEKVECEAYSTGAGQKFGRVETRIHWAGNVIEEK